VIFMTGEPIDAAPTPRVVEKFEAPVELIAPTQQVVTTAMSRVREGKLDAFGRQRVYLKNPEAHTLYEVTEVNAARAESGQVESTGNLGSGLFVREIVMDPITQRPVAKGVNMQMPRAAESVTPSSIYPLRFTQPDRMTRLASDLSSATEAPVQEFEAALDELNRREQAELRSLPKARRRF
jgi:hypothetical protein